MPTQCHSPPIGHRNMQMGVEFLVEGARQGGDLQWALHPRQVGLVGEPDVTVQHTPHCRGYGDGPVAAVGQELGQGAHDVLLGVQAGQVRVRATAEQLRAGSTAQAQG